MSDPPPTGTGERERRARTAARLGPAERGSGSLDIEQRRNQGAHWGVVVGPFHFIKGVSTEAAFMVADTESLPPMEIPSSEITIT